MKIGIAAGVLCGAAAVVAAPSSNVAWTVESVKLVKGGDAAKGEQLAASCAGCHGATGVADTNPMWPSMAGQDALSTYKQLVDFKDGTRSSPMMQGMVMALSDQDMADLSVFYASKPLPPAKGEANATPELVSRGHGERLIPACNSCHGYKGKGNVRSYGMPVLAGQNAEYLKQTLGAYKSGARSNDVYSVMRAIAKELTDEEITDLSAYYAAQGS